MTILFKNSQQAGNVPNLVPGQIGINEADELLWIRSGGKKVAVDILKMQNYAAPSAGGQDGAPLVKTDAGVEWVRSLAPSSEVNGVITVDRSAPNNIYGIPGLMITGFGNANTITGNRAICEHFYVASDQIYIDRVAFKIVSQTQSLIRFAIVADDNTNIYTANISTPNDASVNTANMSVTLERGHYRLVFWSAQPKQLQEIVCLSYDQGFNVDASGNLVFLDHQYTTADFSAGIDVTNVTWTDLTSLTPGTRRYFAFHWSIPA